MSGVHYNAEALRRSLGHFALGKGVTAVSAVVLLLLLARLLPKSDYAIYATLQALVLIVGAVTSFGINQAVLRFLPEMRAQGHSRALYRLVWRTTGTRCLVITLGFAACAATLPWLGPLFGLESRLPWVGLYLLVGTVRLVGFFLSTAMEALMWPRVSQYALAGAAALKLTAVLTLASLGMLDFPTLVLVELVTESLALAALLVGLRLNQRRDPERDAGDADWAHGQRHRMRSFGRWNYLSSLLTQLSTTAPYRMLAAGMLVPEGTALLGLIFSIGDLMYRFMPAKMGRFLLRSVLVAQASTGTSMRTVLDRLNLNFRVNALLLTLFSTCALAAGSGALATATAGKYTQTGPLLAAMGAVLLLNLWRMQFDLLTSINERVRWSVGANIGLLAGPVVAWLAVPQAGVWAILAGAGAGQLAAIAIYAWGLRGAGVARLADARSGLFYAVNLLIAAATLWLLPSEHWAWHLVAALAGFLLSSFLMKPIRWRELGQWRRPAPPLPWANNA